MKNKDDMNLQTYSVAELKKKYLQGDILKEYKKLEPLIDIKAKMIQARLDAQLTQKDLAESMDTYVSNISRLEKSQKYPNIETLIKYAQACGKKLKIEFVD